MEFALALPEEQRWRGEQPKFILRNAMRGLLPESIRLRLTKADFGHVFAKALKAIGGENFFNSLAIGSNEWVNGTELSALYRQMIRSYEGSSQELTPHTWKLWMASGIEVWFRTVFSDADSLSTEILSNQRANIQPVYS